MGVQTKIAEFVIRVENKQRKFVTPTAMQMHIPSVGDNRKHNYLN